MPKPGNLAKQLFCIAIYVAFLVVQLQYNFIHMSNGIHCGPVAVVGVGYDTGTKTSSLAKTTPVQGEKNCLSENPSGQKIPYNLKFSKRYRLSECIGVVALLVEVEHIQFKPVNNFYQCDQRIISGFVAGMSDRGPPIAYIV